MKINKTFLLFSSLLVIAFSSCDKEKSIMRKQSGVWEIKNWQGTTYTDGVVTKDTNVSDMGYLALYDSGLNGQNQVHFHLTYSPSCWKTITGDNLYLDNFDDVCWWQSDANVPDRFALVTLGGWGEYVMMMFTINKLSKDKQEWIFITNSSSAVSSMGAKDVFTMERVKE